MNDFFAKREFDYMTEHEQPTCMIRMGNALILNALTFTGITNSGASIKADGLSLVGFLADKHLGTEEEAAYQTFLDACKVKMFNNYNFIDNTASGSASIIVLAGVNSYGGPYARTGAPSDFGNIKYNVSNIANQIKIEWEADDLAYGSIMITTTDMTVTVVRTGPLQLTVTVGTTILKIDVTTKANVTVENLIGGTVTKSSGISFNPNGMNAVVNMKNIIVPLP